MAAVKLSFLKQRSGVRWSCWVSFIAAVGKSHYHHQTNTLSATISARLLKNSRESMPHWAINLVLRIYVELPDKLSVCGKLRRPMIQLLPSQILCLWRSWMESRRFALWHHHHWDCVQQSNIGDLFKLRSDTCGQEGVKRSLSMHFKTDPTSTCLVLSFYLSFFFVILCLFSTFFALAYINLISVTSVLFICILHKSLSPIPFVFHLLSVSPPSLFLTPWLFKHSSHFTSLAFCSTQISLVVSYSRNRRCFASCLHLLFPINYLSFLHSSSVFLSSASLSPPTVFPLILSL